MKILPSKIHVSLHTLNRRYNRIQRPHHRLKHVSLGCFVWRLGIFAMLRSEDKVNHYEDGRFTGLRKTKGQIVGFFIISKINAMADFAFKTSARLQTLLQGY